YPHHADNQQFLNAKELVNQGSCILWPESTLTDLDANRALELKKLIKSKDLSQMRQSFIGVEKLRAVDLILQELL
ncbi:hypothetical protein MJH12_05820, partial [bacterium]|nr:hypothetical protein [bacterium]